MSLLGKILALLNIFGALPWLSWRSRITASARSGATNTTATNWLSRACPSTSKRTATPAAIIADQLGEETTKAMFSGVADSPPIVFDPTSGNRVGPTQLQEVERHKVLLDGKREAEKGPRAKTYLLSRILLPLSDLHTEREQLLACRSLLATDDKEKAFKDRATKPAGRSRQAACSSGGG